MTYKYAPWKFEYHLDQITPEHLAELPDGTVLYDIFGEKVVKGTDEINDDTRGGFIAYGFKCKQKHDGEDGMGVYESEIQITSSDVLNPLAEGYRP